MQSGVRLPTRLEDEHYRRVTACSPTPDASALKGSEARIDDAPAGLVTNLTSACHILATSVPNGDCMKVLMISDVYFPRVNGVSTSIQTFRIELEKLGVQTRLIAPKYPRPYDESAAVIRVPSRAVPLDPEDRMKSRSAIKALLPSLMMEGFSLVHIQTPFIAHYAGLELAQFLGVPAIATYHTFFQEYLFHYFPFAPKGWMRALARRFSRAQCNQLHSIVVPSAPMRDALAGYGVTAPMHVLPTGLSEDAFRRGDGRRFRSLLGIGANRPVALFAGRVAYEKNIDFLIRSLDIARQSIPDLLLVVAGEGPAMGSLALLVEKLRLKDNVHFVGYLDRRTLLPACYSAADVFVFASRTETQGLVLLEAMALGLPVVSTAVMGTRDVVGPGRGALVPADDENEFAAAMTQVLTDPMLKKKLSTEGVVYAAQWRADVMAARLMQIYQGVAPGRHQ
jgi:1,2-diacylglycerol 3-alpha-glucosyltransferase